MLPLGCVFGDYHACAVLDDATTKCWGSNGSGQLGLGNTATRGNAPGQMGDSLPTVDLGTGRTAVALTAGSGHTCGLLDDATVKCWGENSSGQLGLGDTADRGDGAGEMGDSLPAVNLGTGRTAIAVTAGNLHTCALLDDATVKCWGYNPEGELGLGFNDNRGDGPGEMGDSLPVVALGTGRTVDALVSGGGYHTCALLDDATLKCWGYNADGQLGLGDAAHRGNNSGEMGDSLSAVDLGAGRRAVTVTAGHFHTCAVLDDATTKCWGYNFSGELGLGDTASRGDGPGEMGDSLPVVSLGTGRTAVALTGGRNHTCAVLDNATVKCWGRNAEGEVGVGNTGSWGDEAGEMGDSLPAVDLGTGRTAVAIDAGNPFTCVVLDHARVKCWGQGSILGLGDTAARGDAPGEMGDNLPTLAFGGPLGGAPPRAALVHLAPGSYQFRVVALNSVGESAPGAASAPITVTRAPGLPLGVAGAAGDGQAAVSWTPPVSNGGSAITDYEVSVYNSSGGAPTGVTGATSRLVGSAASSYPFTGLSNGTAYTFRVAALNAAWGSGAASAPSPAVIVGSPVPPTNVVAKSGSTTVATGPLTVTFTIGADNGAAITSQTATCVSSNGGATKTGMHVGAAAAPITVAATTTGKTYTCTVTATNARGAGLASAPSLPVIVGSPVPPTSVKAVSGTANALTGSLVVSFTIGANNGAAITSQTATCTSSNGGATKTGTHVGAGAAAITVATVTYTCTVNATNARGAGLASAPSLPVIVGSPKAPTAVKAVSGTANALTGSLVVSFTIGVNNGAAITSQTATCTSSNGGATKTGTHVGAGAAAITVAAVTTAKTYTCTVRANNALGAGLASAPSVAVIVGSPAVPTGVSAVHFAAGQIKVTFTPGANNGSTTTSYSATCTSSNGGVAGSKTGAASPLTVTTLTVGKTYTCKVKGTNARGAGLLSAPSGAATA